MIEALALAVLSTPSVGLAVGVHPDAPVAFPPAVVDVAALGAQDVLLAVSWWQADVAANVIAPGPGTASDEHMHRVVRRAQALGLGVTLMPIVQLRTGDARQWRGRIRPGDADVWWASYGAFVQRYAVLAERWGVQTLVIGSELTSMSADGYASAWDAVARRARGRFRGRLAYVANHDALDRQAPFRFVDIAGVSAYFPLTEDLDAPQAALVESWRAHAVRLAEFAAAVDRPVVLMEVGYPSIDGAAVQPWNYVVGAPIDLQEQRAAYAAAAQVILRSRAICGVFFWTWFGPGGRFDRHYTPRGKPAERELRKFFRAFRAIEPSRACRGAKARRFHGR